MSLTIDFDPKPMAISSIISSTATAATAANNNRNIHQGGGGGGGRNGGRDFAPPSYQSSTSSVSSSSSSVPSSPETNAEQSHLHYYHHHHLHLHRNSGGGDDASGRSVMENTPSPTGVEGDSGGPSSIHPLPFSLTLQERRQRNKAASAKYRAKKNQQYSEMRGLISSLTKENEILSRQFEHLRRENTRLKGACDRLRGKKVAARILKEFLSNKKSSSPEETLDQFEVNVVECQEDNGGDEDEDEVMDDHHDR